MFMSFRTIKPGKGLKINRGNTAPYRFINKIEENERMKVK